MLTIDGSDGGGQVVRTALTCAALTGSPVRVEHVRGSRPTPGLKPQHVAAARALADVCDGTLDGADDGSDTVTFDPGTPTGGEYAIDVGTAGAVTLVCDALLPLATVIDDPFSVTVTGGTDVKWAPPVDYYRHCKLPLLRRFGLDARLDVERRGFYPAGGGRTTLTVHSSGRSPIELAERCGLDSVAIHSVASESLADADVADRQAATAAEALHDDRVETTSAVSYVDTESPGSAIVLVADYGTTLAGVTSLGERGLPSEDVAAGAVERLRTFDDGSGAVDEHLADQCMLPLALAGGSVRIPRITEHVRTNRDVLAAFGAEVAIDDGEGEGAILDSDGGLPIGSPE